MHSYGGLHFKHIIYVLISLIITPNENIFLADAGPTLLTLTFSNYSFISTSGRH